MTDSLLSKKQWDSDHVRLHNVVLVFLECFAWIVFLTLCACGFWSDYFRQSIPAEHMWLLAGFLPLLLCGMAVLCTGAKICCGLLIGMKQETLASVKSWKDFFPVRSCRSTEVNLSAELAFEKCLAVLSRPLQNYGKIMSIDGPEHRIVTQALGGWEFEIQIGEIDDNHCKVDLSLISKNHYPLVYTWSEVQEVLEKFSTDILIADETTINWKRLQPGRRRRFRNRLIPAGVVALAGIASLSIPSLNHNQQRSVTEAQLISQVTILAWKGATDEAVGKADRAVELARSISDQSILLNALAIRGYVHLVRKELDETITDLTEALRLHNEIEQGEDPGERAAREAYLQLRLSEAFVRKGESSKADQLMARALSLYEKYPTVARLDLLHSIAGFRAYQKGDLDLALKEFSCEMMSRFDQMKLRLETRVPYVPITTCQKMLFLLLHVKAISFKPTATTGSSRRIFGNLTSQRQPLA